MTMAIKSVVVKSATVNGVRFQTGDLVEVNAPGTRWHGQRRILTDIPGLTEFTLGDLTINQHNVKPATYKVGDLVKILGPRQGADQAGSWNQDMNPMIGTTCRVETQMGSDLLGITGPEGTSTRRWTFRPHWLWLVEEAVAAPAAPAQPEHVYRIRDLVEVIEPRYAIYGQRRNIERFTHNGFMLSAPGGGPDGPRVAYASIKPAEYKTGDKVKVIGVRESADTRVIRWNTDGGPGTGMDLTLGQEAEIRRSVTREGVVGWTLDSIGWTYLPQWLWLIEEAGTTAWAKPKTVWVPFHTEPYTDKPYDVQDTVVGDAIEAAQARVRRTTAAWPVDPVQGTPLRLVLCATPDGVLCSWSDTSGPPSLSRIPNRVEGWPIRQPWPVPRDR